MARRCKSVLVFGDIGQGKSSYVSAITQAIALKQKRKILVLIGSDVPAYSNFYRLKDYAELERWAKNGTGFAKFFDNDKKEMLLRVAEWYRNGILIIEDATHYIRGYIPDEVMRFFVDHKNFGVDLFFVYHFLQINPKIKMLATDMVLFKVADSVKTHRKKFEEIYGDNFEEILKAYEEIQRAPQVPGYVQYHKEIKLKNYA